MFFWIYIAQLAFFCLVHLILKPRHVYWMYAFQWRRRRKITIVLGEQPQKNNQKTYSHISWLFFHPIKVSRWLMKTFQMWKHNFIDFWANFFRLFQILLIFTPNWDRSPIIIYRWWALFKPFVIYASIRMNRFNAERQHMLVQIA